MSANIFDIYQAMTKTNADVAAQCSARLAGAVSDGYRRWIDGMTQAYGDTLKTAGELGRCRTSNDVAAVQRAWLEQTSARVAADMRALMILPSTLVAESAQARAKVQAEPQAQAVVKVHLAAPAKLKLVEPVAPEPKRVETKLAEPVMAEPQVTVVAPVEAALAETIPVEATPITPAPIAEASIEVAPVEAAPVAEDEAASFELLSEPLAETKAETKPAPRKPAAKAATRSGARGRTKTETPSAG